MIEFVKRKMGGGYYVKIKRDNKRVTIGHVVRLSEVGFWQAYDNGHVPVGSWYRSRHAAAEYLSLR